MTTTKPGAAVDWTFGEVTVTALSDGWFSDGMDEVITRVDPARARGAQAAALRPDPPRISHTMYLLRGPGVPPTLVDAGMGSGAGPTMGHLPWSLERAGVAADEIATVLLTHLHLDHAGGLVDAAGEARFPNARLVLHADEAAYWWDPRRAAGASESLRPWFDGARAAGEPYRDRVELLAGRTEVAPGVVAEPLPGHTPGHTGYRLTAGDLSLLLWGDVVHLPAVQAPEPEAGVVFDVDGTRAAATRRRVLASAAAEGHLVAGGHTEFPGVARVRERPDGSGYELVPELWTAHAEPAPCPCPARDGDQGYDEPGRQ